MKPRRLHRLTIFSIFSASLAALVSSDMGRTLWGGNPRKSRRRKRLGGLTAGGIGGDTSQTLMPANANYSWEPAGSSYSHPDPNRKLKGWLVIAAGVSFLAHAGLWVLFVNTTLPADRMPTTEMMQKTRTFKIDRVTLNETVVIEERSRDEAEMADILETDAAPLVKEIDENDPNIYDKLPEHEVRLDADRKDERFPGERAAIDQRGE